MKHATDHSVLQTIRALCYIAVVIGMCAAFAGWLATPQSQFVNTEKVRAAG